MLNFHNEHVRPTIFRAVSRRTETATYLCWRSPRARVHPETSKLHRGSLHTAQPGNEEELYSDRWISCLGAVKKKEKKKE